LPIYFALSVISAGSSLQGILVLYEMSKDAADAWQPPLAWRAWAGCHETPHRRQSL